MHHTRLGQSLGRDLLGAVSSSADVTRIATQTPGGAEVIDLASGTSYAVTTSTAGFTTPLLSPDGATVALQSAYQVEFVDELPKSNVGKVLRKELKNLGKAKA